MSERLLFSRIKLFSCLQRRAKHVLQQNLNGREEDGWDSLSTSTKYFYLFWGEYFYSFFRNILIFFFLCDKNIIPGKTGNV